MSEHTKEQEKRKGSCRMYTMSDVPEYKEISDQWLVAENELTVYRDRCMKEGTHFMDQVQRGCRISNVFDRRQPRLLLHL